MRGPQVRLRGHRLTQALGRMCIASTHDLEMRELFVSDAVVRIVGANLPQPALWIATARHHKGGFERIDLERRVSLARGELRRARKRRLRLVVLAFFQRHPRGEQVSADDAVVVLERFLDERLRAAFEAVGKDARQTELRVYVVRCEIERFLEELDCLRVLMRLYVQMAPAYAFVHCVRIDAHAVAEELVGTTHVMEPPC